MALDVTRVTVLGGGKRKVAMKDRRGAATDFYDVRWRVQLRSGETRMFRQRFDRSGDADGLVRWLLALGLPASGWHLDDDGRPSDELVSIGSSAGTDGVVPPCSCTGWRRGEERRPTDARPPRSRSARQRDC